MAPSLTLAFGEKRHSTARSFPQNMSERLKLEIRRRLYAERLKSGRAVGTLANWFVTCPNCKGRRKTCTEGVQDGSYIAALHICQQCEGDGFVAVT